MLARGMTAALVPSVLVGAAYMTSSVSGSKDPQARAWYDALDKSPWTPPDATFGLVWAILYALIWVAIAWSIWSRKPLVLGLLVASMLMNIAWTPVFFLARRVRLAFAILTITVVLAWVQLGVTTQVRGHRGLRWLVLVGLTMYALWVSYAWYLNGWITLHNNRSLSDDREKICDIYY